VILNSGISVFHRINVPFGYEIIDRKTGKLVFTKDITVSGTPLSVESLSGWGRRQEAVNQSVRNNIKQFLQTLENTKIKEQFSLHNFSNK
jgi:hypothetical protein